MGPERTQHPTPRRRTRRLVVGGLAVASLTLGGCSSQLTEQWKRGGLPESATAQGHLVKDMWVGFWICALIIGVLVWGLIIWASIAYRRRHPDLPVQTRYNMPIEALYTIAPIMIVAVLFVWTVKHQDKLLHQDANPDVTIGVIGQRWSWTFNYLKQDAYDVGTAVDAPTLYLPVNKTVRFELESPDVNHSFWVPAFYFKMDVIPGKKNSFQVTPDKEGTFVGKCAELCGTYHSRMLFNVKVVSQDMYDAHMAQLKAKGQSGAVEAPLTGSYSTVPLDNGRKQKDVAK